ncbi:hypothetical protein B0H13DRAFT_2341056 [Mycena leptocephala]|nr:hypothetical protein B0H13DRAFT_2341056 [Mycena leptocephala]
MDILTLTLVLCLLATNLNRLLVTSCWIWEYLCRPREPQLIPYFDEQGMFQGVTVKGLLSGQSDALRDIPAGFFLNAVVYHLDGGQSAQSFFQKQQIELAKKLSLYFEPTSGIPSTCELRRPNLEIITAKDRWWLPHGSSTVDYRIPQKSPQKSPTKKWHPPMVQRDPSLPPIASFDELSSSGDAFPSTARQLRCDPCDAFGFAAEDSDVVACRKCGFWSHIACVKPLAYVDSDPDSDAESELEPSHTSSLRRIAGVRQMMRKFVGLRSKLVACQIWHRE